MRLLVLLVIVMFYSCSNEPISQERPSHVISEDTMAVLIAEHYILNAISQDREVRKKRLTDFVKEDQKQLYDSVAVTKHRFDTSMQYYLNDYNKMVKLHQQAMEILSTRMAEIKAAGADSLTVEPKISLKKLEAKNSKN